MTSDGVRESPTTEPACEPPTTEPASEPPMMVYCMLLYCPNGPDTDRGPYTICDDGAAACCPDCPARLVGWAGRLCELPIWFWRAATPEFGVPDWPCVGLDAAGTGLLFDSDRICTLPNTAGLDR